MLAALRIVTTIAVLAVIPDASGFGATESKLRVQVVDSAGKPCARVPLAIRSALVPDTLTPIFATTRDDGIAEFADVDRIFSDESQKKIPLVVFEFPLKKQDGTPVLMRAAPKDPLKLVLPPVGSVALHALDNDGDRHEEPLMATMSWSDPATGSHRECKGDWSVKEKGTLEFPFVGPGVEWRVAGFDSERFGKVDVTGAPLASARERCEMDVRLPGARVLTRRLLAEDGTPLVDTEVEVVECEPESAIPPITRPVEVHRTDGRGHLRIPLDDLTHPDKLAAWTRASHRVRGVPGIQIRRPAESGHELEHAWIAIAARTKFEAVGDLTLDSRPRIACGLLQDWDPVSIGLVERDEVQVGGLPVVRWRTLQVPRHPLTNPGSFDLRGEPVKPEREVRDEVGNVHRIRTFMKADEVVLPPRFVALPADPNQPVVFDPMRWIHPQGCLLVDAWVNLSDLRIELSYLQPSIDIEWLLHDPDGGPPRTAIVARIDPARRVFSWDLLVPGEVEIRMTHPSAREPLFVLRPTLRAGKDLPTGTNTIGPPKGIDLRGKIPQPR